MSLKTHAKDVYIALKDAEMSGRDLPNGPEKVELLASLDRLHHALNGLRKMLGMTFIQFMDFIEEEPPVEALTGGSGGKDD